MLIKWGFTIILYFVAELYVFYEQDKLVYSSKSNITVFFLLRVLLQKREEAMVTM